MTTNDTTLASAIAKVDELDLTEDEAASLLEHLCDPAEVRGYVLQPHRGMGFLLEVAGIRSGGIEPPSPSSLKNVIVTS